MALRPDGTAISNRIRQWRKRRGLTLQVLAGMLGTSAGHLHKWETGKVSITLDRLDDGALEGFYLALADEFGPEREATIATYVAAARAFLRHCLREGSLTTLSIERAVERLHGVRSAPRYRTPRVDDALAIIVDYVKNELPALIPADAGEETRLRFARDRALLQVLYGTGMRRAEVARLDRRDVDDGHAQQALITGKGRRERVVFFDDDARERILSGNARRLLGLA